MPVSDRSMVEKLRVKPGSAVLVMNPPSRFLEQFLPLPEGARIVGREAQGADLGLLFARDSATLRREVKAFLAAVKPDGSTWIAYPKKSGAIATDLTRDDGWEAVVKAGLESVALIALDADWSAVRFKPGLGAHRGQCRDHGEETALIDALFAGKRRALRPICDRLLTIGRSLGKDVRIAPTKTYVPLYRRYQFAQIRPTTLARVDLLLCLRDIEAGGRLISTGGLAKGDRMTHRIALGSVGEIDADVRRWYTEAYRRGV